MSARVCASASIQRYKTRSRERKGGEEKRVEFVRDDRNFRGKEK